jgi:3-isopropylmalate/(R)-2-methylmalate dehydratase small subunit
MSIDIEPFTVLTALAAPLPWADVNTDDIFPIPRGAGMTPESLQDPALLARNAFAGHRWNGDGSPKPEFVLNREPFDRAAILIAGENFGCGSSREMAVWSLSAIGIRCVIAPSFGDIFYANCINNGVLPVMLPQPRVTALINAVTACPAAPLTVDLRAMTVSAVGHLTSSFTMAEYHRQALLLGLDEIATTLHRLPTIEAHEAAYLKERPWLVPAAK